MKTLNCPLSYPDFKVNNINAIKQHLLESKFVQSRLFITVYTEWSALTLDAEVLQTVKGMHINITTSLPSTNSFQYSFNELETEFVRQEIQNLLGKRVIASTEHEPGELISPIFVRPKTDGGMKLILNLKSLNKSVPYKKFKMDTISSILHLVRPNMFLAKLDIQDAYYSIPIEESHQKLLKFKFEGKLYKFLALPNGYTEGPRKFTKLLKPPLATLRVQWRILVASYIDDLITMNMALESCMDNISKLIEILMSLGFVIHPSKSEFIPSKTIEYLRYDTEDMTIKLTYAKKMVIFNMCTSLCSTNSCSIRDVAQLLGRFSSSLIAVKMGRLHYRSLERAKVKHLKASRGNFDKTIALDGQSKLDILWWRDNIMNSHSPILQGNPTTHIYTLMLHHMDGVHHEILKHVEANLALLRKNFT